MYIYIYIYLYYIYSLNWSCKEEIHIKDRYLFMPTNKLKLGHFTMRIEIEKKIIG